MVGVELEFYSSLPKEFFGNTLLPARDEGFEITIKEEIGKGQLEAVFRHSQNIPKVLKDVIDFKKKFKDKADFKAYHHGLPSCALQFNISILKDGKPLLFKFDILSEGSASTSSHHPYPLAAREGVYKFPLHKKESSLPPAIGEGFNKDLQADGRDDRNTLCSNILHHLLADIKPNLHIFAPTQNCRLRLSDIEKIRNYRNSPYTLCVGDKNNRTTAIRVLEERIEHRVPSASAPLIPSFRVILNSIQKGINETEQKYTPIIYSNAFEEEVISLYNLERII